MQQPDKFAYFGTPRVASETLETLIEHGFKPAVVITSPDAPRGRGLALAPSPAKSLALAHSIPVLAPPALSAGALASIAAYDCAFAVVVAYGKILPKALIDAFPLGIVNVHYSLLPKYRGAAPLEAALLAGERETGVTIQKVAEELDAGDILAQAATPIAPSETARELRPRLIRMGAELLAQTLPPFARGEITPVPQDAARLPAGEAGASRARKMKKEDGLLSLPAACLSGRQGRQVLPQQDLENWNKYRAYADTIGTYFFENGKRMKITEASFRGGVFAVERVIPEGKRETAYVRKS